MPNVRNMPQPMNIAAPTNRGLEPITEGVPIGEGGGPTKNIQDDVDILLNAMYSVNPDPVIAQLINNRNT